MIDHSDVMERTCEVADFLTLRYCKKHGIENPIIFPEDDQDCSVYSEQAQSIFNNFYDTIEPIIEMKFKEEFVAKVIKSNVDIDDYWDSFSEEEDVNIWIDDEGIIHANAYDVVDGKTITDHWRDIKVKQVLV